MSSSNDRAWFAAKRFGYGAGWPIAWQGWVLLALYMAVMLAPAPLIEWDPIIGTGVAICIWFVATIAVIVIAKRKTRGGWRWRDGEDD
ncbi:hypothetical protein [Qipengyuania sp.]|uniref:hypothetical protein n=1 Tax=Qipengyuania sp. TaxID=2004515 RepID=UPI0035161162